MNDITRSRTNHKPECWRAISHHLCAVEKIESQAYEIDRLRDALEMTANFCVGDWESSDKDRLGYILRHAKESLAYGH